MTDDHYKKAKRLVSWATLIALFVIAAFILQYTNACGTLKPRTTQVQPVPPPPGPTPPPPATHCDDGAAVGDTKDAACPTGQIGKVTTICLPTGWKEAANTCVTPPAPTCGKTLFAEVQPILKTYCAGCHVTPGDITTYPVASSWKNGIASRTLAPAGNNDHMPKGTAPQLCPPNVDPKDCDKIQLLQKWVSDGAIQDCSQASTRADFYDLKTVDTIMVADLMRLASTDRHFIRYLVVADAINAGLTGEALATYEQAMNKTINGLNNELQDIFPVQRVDPAGAVWRIDLRAYGIGSAEIALVEAADVNLNIIDNTSEGQILQALTGTTKPWFNADEFIDVTSSTSSVYYGILNIPKTLPELLADIGVAFAVDLANLDAAFIGTNSSTIAEEKNRLVVRVSEQRSQDAYFYQTFDINNVKGNADPALDTKNLSAFPCLPGTGCVHNYTPDASEVIFTLPNGLQAYVLYDAVGNRLDAAALNVVRDTDTKVGDGSIVTSISCEHCHNAGLIPVQDQIAAAVKRNAGSFGNDAQIVERLYKGPEIDNAIFIHDNAIIAKQFAKLGINPLKTDPIKLVTDKLKLNYDLTWAASKLLLTPPQMIDAIGTSLAAQAQIGALLAPGGLVTAGQFFAVLPQLKKDARLFQDPVGQ